MYLQANSSWQFSGIGLHRAVCKYFSRCKNLLIEQDICLHEISVLCAYVVVWGAEEIVEDFRSFMVQEQEISFFWH